VPVPLGRPSRKPGPALTFERIVTGRAGRITTTVARKSADGGWHWLAWGCEFLGTAILLAGGLSAVFLDFGPSSPIAKNLPSMSARLLLTGLLFAGTGSLVALSPLGRRSGAHLNPSVTLAFWTQHKVHPHDLAGYVSAQILGAITSVAVLRLAWGHTARALHLGATQPGHGFTALDAAGLECAMTASLVLMIFFMTSSRRTARWTPLGNWLLVATLVWQGAPYTGTSLNPARSLAPALLAPEIEHLWVYIAGPLTGALLAALIFTTFRTTHTLTAKLFHDPSYPSTLASELPTAVHLHEPTGTSPIPFSADRS
jgi:aquaporin Z